MSEKLMLPAELAVPIEPFTDEELDEYVDATVAGAQVPAKVGTFVLDTEPKAEWALRKLAALVAREDDARDQAEEYHALIEEWLQERLRYVQPRRAVFEGALEQYGKNRREADDRDKTIKLPSGTIATIAAQKPTVHIGNEEAVLAWAVKHLPEDERNVVVKLNPKVLVTELRKVIAITKSGMVVHAATGEVVPGCYVEQPGQITAKVKPT